MGKCSLGNGGKVIICCVEYWKLLIVEYLYFLVMRICWECVFINNIKKRIFIWFYKVDCDNESFVMYSFFYFFFYEFVKDGNGYKNFKSVFVR